MDGNEWRDRRPNERTDIRSRQRETVFHDRALQNCQPDDIGNRKEQTKQRDHGHCLSISTRAFQLFLMEAE